jgi:putative endonuclease
MWFVYIVRTSSKTLYTGITTDIARRVSEHNSTTHKAAKYTRAHCPVILVYWEKAQTRSEALQREHTIKSMTKQEKEKLIQSAV